jgi:hypothetical protein
VNTARGAGRRAANRGASRPQGCEQGCKQAAGLRTGVQGAADSQYLWPKATCGGCGGPSPHSERNAGRRPPACEQGGVGRCPSPGGESEGHLDGSDPGGVGRLRHTVKLIRSWLGAAVDGHPSTRVSELQHGGDRPEQTLRPILYLEGIFLRGACEPGTGGPKLDLRGWSDARRPAGARVLSVVNGM